MRSRRRAAPSARKYAPPLAGCRRPIEKRASPSSSSIRWPPIRAEDIQAAIKANGLTGPYVHDKDGAFTAAIGAGVTTDAFVLDPTRTIIYRGAIDDQYGQGYSHDSPKQTYLAAALDALLAGKSPIIAAMEAPGCALEAKKSTTTVSLTYQRDVSRLVQTHCVECHRKDGVAPFSLENYKDVVAHAGEIKRVVERGTMPPWFAAPTAKGPTPWINDRSLAKNDKADLLAWLKSDRRRRQVRRPDCEDLQRRLADRQAGPGCHAEEAGGVKAGDNAYQMVMVRRLSTKKNGCRRWRSARRPGKWFITY